MGHGREQRCRERGDGETETHGNLLDR